MGKHRQIDSEVVPEFYATKSDKNRHNLPAGTVLAISSEHDFPGYFSMGYVSKQTPFGQGTFMGFHEEELRKATPEEIKRAIKTKHPYGRRFRPYSQEASNAAWNIFLSKTFSNWTTDSSDTQPVLDVSRKQIEDYGKEAAAKHRKILRNWGRITRNQRNATIEKLKR